MPGVIERSFWRSPGIRSLPDPTKLLATYLMTGPHHNTLGCFYLPPQYIAADLGWGGLERAVQGVDALESLGFALWCRATEFVFLPEWTRFHPIQNLNQGRARMAMVDQIPSAFGYAQALRHSLEKYGSHLPKDWSDRFDRFGRPGSDPRQQSLNPSLNGSANPSRTIERDRDRERDRERESVKGDKSPAQKFPSLGKLRRRGKQRIYPDAFLEAWKVYPPRAGGNSKASAYRAWRTRVVQDGWEPNEITQGVMRYRQFCDLTKKTGTELVKQAATFFGPDEHFLEEWDLGRIPQSRQDEAWAAVEAMLV